mmetsp:Transcript_13771/g.39360  ORF Transcript_13771/g.39360 Transcript_13771/m.39360 type:complete len:235 (-) Transcript_13771:536-1240(-)
MTRQPLFLNSCISSGRVAPPMPPSASARGPAGDVAVAHALRGPRARPGRAPARGAGGARQRRGGAGAELRGEVGLGALGPLADLVAPHGRVQVASAIAMLAVWINVDLGSGCPILLHRLVEGHDIGNLDARVVGRHGDEGGGGPGGTAEACGLHLRVEQQHEVGPEADVVDLVHARVGSLRRGGEPKRQVAARAGSHEADARGTDAEFPGAAPHEAQGALAVHLCCGGALRPRC